MAGTRDWSVIPVSLSITLGAAVSLSVVPGPVHAQSGAEVEEVVVTARRTAERLLDVPLSVSAFSEADVNRLGLTDIQRVAAQTPGLQFDTGAAPDDIRPSLRGIPLIEGRSNVAILIDGVDITGLTLDDSYGGGGSSLDLGVLDLERIEVVKGPQSVYFGRSAFAGAVQFVTKLPGESFESKINAGVGNFGMYEIAGHIGGPVGNSGLRLKLSASTSSFDGYYKNPGNGLELGNRNTDGVGLTAVFEPSDAFQMIARAFYVEAQRGQPAGYNQIRTLPPTSTVVKTFTEDDFDPSRIGFSTNVRWPGSDMESLRANLEFNIGLGESWSLRSLTGLNDNDGVVTYDFDQSPLDTPMGAPVGPDLFNCLAVAGCVGIYDYDVDLKQVSQELRLTYDGGGALKFMVGGYYFDESYEQVEYNRFVGSSSTVGTTRANIVPRPYTQDTKAWSMFASIDYRFSDRWSVNAEARYNNEEIRGRAPNFNDLLQIGAATFVIDAEAEFSNTNPRVSLNYKPAENSLYYLSVARGSKPGGVNLGQVTEAIRFFDEEKILTYELGAKGVYLDGRLRVTAAAYVSDYEGTQVTNVCFGQSSPFGPEANCPNSPAVSLSFIDNAEGADISGLELEVNARLTDNFSAMLAYAYTDATFNRLITSAAGVPPALVVNGRSDFTGNDMPLIPKNSVMLSGRYEREVTSGTEGFIELSGRYRSKRFARFTNLQALDDKTIVDLQLGLRASQWSATLFANNLLDDLTPDFIRYAVNINPLNPNTDYVSAPPKRTYGLRVSYEF
jgi:iron complex outermembrane recepter protein